MKNVIDKALEYVEEVFKVLDEETDKDWEEMVGYLKEDFLEELRREGKLKED